MCKAEKLPIIESAKRYRLSKSISCPFAGKGVVKPMAFFSKIWTIDRKGNHPFGQCHSLAER